MRSYWVRIVFGACAIFVVGYAGVYAVRKSVHRFRSLTESSESVSIPLAFLPFTLDGVKAGTFKQVRIERDAPKSLTGIMVRIALVDSADVQRIQACRITLQGNGHDFDPSRGFRCLAPDEVDSSLVPFGQVRFSVRHGEDFSVPLLLDSSAVADMRNSGKAEISATVGAEAEARAEAAGRRADSITTAVNRQVDSIVKRTAPPTPKRPPAAPKPR